MTNKYYYCCSRKGTTRFLTVKKKDGSEAAHSVMNFNLSHNTKHVVRSLLQRFPVTYKERTDLLPKTERGSSLALEAGKHVCFLSNCVLYLYIIKECFITLHCDYLWYQTHSIWRYSFVFVLLGVITYTKYIISGGYAFNMFKDANVIQGGK